MLDCKKVSIRSGYSFVIFVHADTCDPIWQSSRDGLIISAHVFSDISLLILVAAGIYFAMDYISKECVLCAREIILFDSWCFTPTNN